jgi:hypothetical protein
MSEGLGMCNDKMNEAELWKTYLSRRNLQGKMRALTETIEGLGSRFMSLCDDLDEDLETLMGYEDVVREHFPDVSPEDLLRIVRNSTHGYLFDSERNRNILLSSSGEMSVYIQSGAAVLATRLIEPIMRKSMCA